MNFLRGRVPDFGKFAGSMPAYGSKYVARSMTAFARESALEESAGTQFLRAVAARATRLALALIAGSVLAAGVQAQAPSASSKPAAAVPPPPLPVDVAFPMTAALEKNAAGNLVLKIDMQPGHYIYLDRFEFQRDGEAVYGLDKKKQPGTKPVQKKDPQFGDVWVYDAPVSLKVGHTKAKQANLVVMYQGCSELAGVCYPPTKRSFAIKEAGVEVAAAEVVKPGLGAQFKKQVSQ